MRAVIITQPGGPEVLALREVPDPTPGKGELLVRVEASALNRADLLQRRGLYPAPPGAPKDIPGLELAGTVVACGEGVTRFAPGDGVMGVVAGGACADLAVLHEREAIRRPAGMPATAAAGITSPLTLRSGCRGLAIALTPPDWRGRARAAAPIRCGRATAPPATAATRTGSEPTACAPDG